MPEYNVYVIELDKEVMKINAFRKINPDYNPEKPCVYVGQTAKTPEERFKQHKEGNHANRYAKKHGFRLRSKLFEKHNSLPSRGAAKEKETWLGKHLRKKGYDVWWN